MPILYNLLAVALALQQSLVLANPLPMAKTDVSKRIVLPMCASKTIYNITYANPEAIGAGIVGDLYCNGNDQGCTLSQTQSFSIAVEVSVGVDLDLGAILGSVAPDLSFGVSITKETGTAATAGKNCPSGPWTCALVFSPNVLHVEGTQSSFHPCIPSIEPTRSPYIMDFPRANADGVYGGGIDICVCMDFPNALDKGAPSLQCPKCRH